MHEDSGFFQSLVCLIELWFPCSVTTETKFQKKKAVVGTLGENSVLGDEMDLG